MFTDFYVIFFEEGLRKIIFSIISYKGIMLKSLFVYMFDLN